MRCVDSREISRAHINTLSQNVYRQISFKVLLDPCVQFIKFIRLFSELR